MTIPTILSQNYLPDYIATSPCQQVEGGDWILVRHANLASIWHPNTDKLEGTQSYGGFGGTAPSSYPNDPAYSTSYSIPFNHMMAGPTKILFSDTKCDNYIVTRFADIRCDAHGIHGFLLDNIIATSDTSNNKEFQIYSRCGDNHDPLVSMDNPWHSTDNSGAGLLYIANSVNTFPTRRAEMENSNVWIQVPGISNTLQSNVPAVYHPNGYINVPEYAFYGTIFAVAILLLFICTCVFRSKGSGKRPKYETVSMHSATDIEN
eukprot:CAMPEP_0201566606 /NCGR_PEP_ID=MMETSP0190_2-20130828/6498_1 /ASSEMBLY_ACC=CAM_ASM_000263 /TAXON_ID=37353 /ORGANISM="Rosalina sp." /LENGTH=261 /DNA_ID=CAMNT_0047985541 /DNA_START=96 /DNA_END=881 /DNA_ORIENTATION=+